MVTVNSEEVLTISEIEKRYDGEWVLVEDPELDQSNAVLTGKVLFHSRDRDAVDLFALRVKPRRSAYVYTGQIPDNIFINL